MAGLPPATIINVETDPLASDGQLLAEKLQAAGVKTRHELYKGVTHEFFGMDAIVGDAARVQDLAAGELKAALAGNVDRAS